MMTEHGTTAMGPSRRFPRILSVVEGVTAARIIITIAAAGLAASYLVTWNLWLSRTTPPNLPIIAAAGRLPLGYALLGALMVCLVRPKAGVIAHTLLFVVAVLGDQIRLQPEFVSLSIVLLGSVLPKALAVSRWHVITRWFWAGAHKALSLGWAFGGAGFIANTIERPDWRTFIAWAVPAVEIALGVAALWRRLWPVLAVVGGLFHLGVAAVLYLSHSNTAVWPWNVALAFVVPALFLGAHRSRDRDEAPTAPRFASILGAHRSRDGEARPSPRRLAPIVVAGVFAVFPAGFYVGIGDAYLAHNLYSSNTAQAYVCQIDQPLACGPAPFLVYEELNVPMPPERRLFIGWFTRQCQPGTLLRIDGIATRLRSGDVETRACTRQPSAGPVDATPTVSTPLPSSP